MKFFDRFRAPKTELVFKDVTVVSRFVRVMEDKELINQILDLSCYEDKNIVGIVSSYTIDVAFAIAQEMNMSVVDACRVIETPCAIEHCNVYKKKVKKGVYIYEYKINGGFGLYDFHK